jgi:anthranilate synthase component 1
MTFTEFNEFAKTYRYVPMSRELMADVLTPVSLFYAIREGANRPFLFESVEGGEQLARYSFIGYNPYRELRYEQGKVVLEDLKVGKVENLDESYFSALKRLTQTLDSPKIADLPKFTGGAVGFSSYDTILELEGIPVSAANTLELPEAVWAFYNKLYAFDHVKHRILLIHLVDVNAFTSTDEAYKAAIGELDEMQQRAHNTFKADTKVQIDPAKIESNMDQATFETAVDKIKKHIYEGDIFQGVFSQRFHTDFEGDAFMLYRALRMVNPSPYLFFIENPQFNLIGSSPEVLVSVENGEARVLPIAGTRPRGKNEAEDLAFEQDLMADTKEQAEHIMLVDLGRNDMTRVCDPKTVHVSKSAYVERYSHVMHIVSEVRGQLDKSLSPVDALMRCAPAGTVSGAPKIRAMQIINDLEPTKRGPYAGAVGYFDHFGNMDTCIAIRTMVAKNNKIYIQSGAGIVADSVPTSEYEETVNKAKALFAAMEKALQITF